eukprot:351041-Amphidinium_carterae.1
MEALSLEKPFCGSLSVISKHGDLRPPHDDRCLYCGEDELTLLHLLYSCPRFAAPRSLSYDSVAHLASCFVHHGIVPEEDESLRDLSLVVTNPDQSDAWTIGTKLSPRLQCARCRRVRAWGDKATYAHIECSAMLRVAKQKVAVADDDTLLKVGDHDLQTNKNGTQATCVRCGKHRKWSNRGHLAHFPCVPKDDEESIVPVATVCSGFASSNRATRRLLRNSLKGSDLPAIIPIGQHRIERHVEKNI